MSNSMTNVNCPQAAVRARPSVAGQTFTVAMELPPSYEEATKQETGGLNKTSHGNVKMHGFENLCHVSAVHSTG